MAYDVGCILGLWSFGSSGHRTTATGTKKARFLFALAIAAGLSHRLDQGPPRDNSKPKTNKQTMRVYIKIHVHMYVYIDLHAYIMKYIYIYVFIYTDIRMYMLYVHM